MKHTIADTTGTHLGLTGIESNSSVRASPAARDINIYNN